MLRSYGRLASRFVLPLYDRLAGRRIWEEWRALRKLQWRSSEELEERAEKRLSRLIVHAGTHVPFYREHFANAGIDPEKPVRIADLERLPVTTKAQLRAAFPSGALADNLPAGRYYRKLTSGSTGLPLEFFADRRAIDSWMASYLFFREWAHAPLGLMQLQIAAPPRFTGRLENEAFRIHSPGRSRWARRLLLGEISVRLSGIDLTLPEFLSEVRKAGKRDYFILAFPSYAASLAAQILDSGWDPPRIPRAVISYAETLTPVRQRLIEKAFCCRVANHYSSLEVLHMAQTCPDNPALLHVNTERAILRIVREDGQSTRPGEAGRILATDLANEAMPFINYDTGDWGVAGTRCPCGRGFPTVMSIDGREAECFHTPSGKTVSPGTLGSFFGGPEGEHPHIWEYQALLTAPDSLNLRIVPAASFTAAISDQLIRHLEAWLGPGLSVTITLVDRIDPEPSGKRIVIKSQPERDPFSVPGDRGHG
jgi:phenylacetate-CoA ligase